MSVEVLRQLETSFGKIPQIIEENIKYICYDAENEAFHCVPCGKSIEKVSNNKHLTKIHLETHLSSKSHSTNTYTVDEIKAALEETFSGNIPQVVLNNIYVLGMDDMNYNCTMCEKFIPESSNPQIMKENFSYHLLSWGHLDNLENYRLTLCHLQDVYGGISDVILNNINFIDIKGEKLFCRVCEKDLLIDQSDLEKTELDFENHFMLVDHLRKVKQEKVFTLIPELKQVYTHVPNHILRNVEYISFNGNSFFCSLCNSNIQYVQNDPYMTEQNLKLHNLSVTHEQSLLSRRDPDNNVYIKLNELFEVFPETVSYNLKYLTLLDELLMCCICDESIVKLEEGGNVIQEKIKMHFDSEWHENNDGVKCENSLALTKEFEEIFGCVPNLIQDNIEHTEYRFNESGFYCRLCNEKLEIVQTNNNSINNASTVKDMFEKHLNSAIHKKELEDLEELSKSLQTDIESLFHHIPPLITKNWNHIGYDEQGCNFFCFLCNETIAVTYGSKKKLLTLQNFQTHFLSASHIKELKKRAKNEQETTEKLESIFGKVPSLILSNIDHLGKDSGKFCCVVCNTKILSGSTKTTIERYFYQHLKSTKHKDEVRMAEKLKDEAFHELNDKLGFWRIPEFLLRIIDFMCLIGNDLFCALCQENLLVDDSDLSFTKQTLRTHFDSKQHQHNLQTLTK